METVQKVLITYSKHGLIRFIGHLDTMSVILQAMRRAALPLCYSQGFNPHVKASFSLPLPLGFSSDAEFIELSLNSSMKTDDIRMAIQKELPEGLEIRTVEKIPVLGSSASGKIEAIQYHFNYKSIISDSVQLEENKKRLLGIPGVLNIELDENSDCNFTIELGRGKEVSPREIARALLGIDEGSIKLIEFTRKKFIFKV
jgi:radical SAM-linked protein